MKEVQTLLSSGHEISVLIGSGYPGIEDLDEKAALYLFNVSFPRNGIRSFLSYVLTIVRTPPRIISVALRSKTEVIHVQDLPFCSAALPVGILLRVPVLLEIREPFATAIGTDLRPLFKGSIGRLILKLIAKVFTLVEVLVCFLVNGDLRLG